LPRSAEKQCTLRHGFTLRARPHRCPAIRSRQSATHDSGWRTRRCRSTRP
jgi:hypothetical protein